MKENETPAIAASNSSLGRLFQPQRKLCMIFSSKFCEANLITSEWGGSLVFVLRCNVNKNTYCVTEYSEQTAKVREINYGSTGKN